MFKNSLEYFRNCEKTGKDSKPKAAQAKSLSKLKFYRQDIIPYVFDVSSDYKLSWDQWLPIEQQATYEVPENWNEKFDLVTSYFVLEHVDDPVGYLRKLTSFLKPEGRVLISFPNVDANPGDMIVADHLNHFSTHSLIVTLSRAGLAPLKIIRDPLLSSFFVLAAGAPSGFDKKNALDAIKRNTEICEFWQVAARRLNSRLALYRNGVCAIYGAGFYGSWLRLQIGDSCKLTCFLDMNEKLQGKEHLDLPIVSPKDLPAEVKTVFIGLNPLKARQIIANVPAFEGRDIEFVWLD